MNKILFPEFSPAEMLSQRTLCFIINENKILLGKKIKGFGMGKYLGIGGKIERDEGVLSAVVREMQEEVGITPIDPQKMAQLEFYFPEQANREKWEQCVHVYLSSAWNGKIVASEEMVPKWFELQEIPYSKMWADAKYWLPRVLQGERLHGQFVFDSQLSVKRYQMEALT